MSVEVAAELDAAADYIEQHGWHQGGYYDPAGMPQHIGWSPYQIAEYHPPACAEGAIALANSDNIGYAVWPDNTDASVQALVAVINHEPAHEDMRSIPSWNDAEGRTQAEVVATLRKAAEQQARAGS